MLFSLLWRRLPTASLYPGSSPQIYFIWTLLYFPFKLEPAIKNKNVSIRRQDGSNIGGSGVHFPSTPGKYLADLRSRANSQQYSSIYKDQRSKIEDVERSEGKKSAQGQ